MKSLRDGAGEAPWVSVIIVNTNEKRHLVRCLPAALSQSYPRFEVIVVDNASTDGSPGFIRQRFPAVRLVESAVNLGYPGANNLGFLAAKGSYLAVLNPDTEVDHRWLAELVQALEREPAAGLATSKILLMDRPAQINACGNVISMVGLTFCRGIGEPEWEYAVPDEVPAVSGAAFLIRRSTLEAIGPFDEDFFMYLEETDLSLRAILAGHKCLYVPASRAYHSYTFRFSEKKCFHIEKNRLYMLLKVLRPRTLLLLAPALCLAEALVWGYLLMKGPRYLRQKWLSYRWLWRHRALARARHAQTQRLRRVSDREILRRLSPELPFPQVAHGRLAGLLRVVTAPILSGLYGLTLKFAS